MSREAVADSQRQRIIKAMVAAVATRGYGDTRVVDVIQRAKVSRKTFYELFADKEECFLAAYDYVFTRLYQGSADAFEVGTDRPWAERIRTGLAVLLDRLAEEPEAARFAIIEVLAAGPKALARRDAAIREFTHFVDAGRSEASHEVPGITATAVVGGIYELLYSEILHGATAQLPARLPEIVYWISQPFLGAKGAAKERERARDALAARV